MDEKAAVRSLRMLLFSPETFFEAHLPRQTVSTAFIVVLAVALVSTVGFALIGWLFASNIDATETVITMEPWSNSTCEGFQTMDLNTNVSTIPEQCTIDEPRTKQIDVGDKVWDAFLGQLPVFLFFRSSAGF